MDKKEIERKIKIYTEVKECAEESIAEYQLQLKKPEPEKPKPLEHGDYGTFKNGTARIDIDDTIYDKDGRCGNPKDTGFYTIFGNIFKEVEALSEPLKEFEMDDLKVSLDKDGDWRLVQGGDTILINPEERHDFILKLRRMEAWILQQEATKNK